MIIKVNNLTNLQDARYCAAMGVDVLTFATGEGCLHKLPDDMIGEIAGWVEGPEIVLNFGHDYERAASTREHPDVQIEIAVRMRDTSAILTGGNVRLTIELTAQDTPDEVLKLMDRYRQSVRYLEIAPMEPISWICDLLTPIPNLVLNLDHCKPDLISSLTFHLAGISMRQCIEEDMLRLDYDRCEAMFQMLEPFREPV